MSQKCEGNCGLWVLNEIIKNIYPEIKKKWLVPFGSYLLNSTANPAHFHSKPSFEVNGLDWHCCLAGSSKRAPRILIFSIAVGAEYLSYVKSIATFAPTFYGYIISVLASV